MSPGSWIGPLENGSLVISGVKIHSSGEFTLRVVNFHDEGGLTPFNSTSFTVTNFISSASVTIDASITTYFNFAFTISFMGEDSLPFLIPVMTTITINNGTIFGTTGMTVTTTGTFTIYADDSSATLLTYTVDAPYEFSGTKSVTINPCSLFPVYTPVIFT